MIQQMNLLLRRLLMHRGRPSLRRPDWPDQPKCYGSSEMAQGRTQPIDRRTAGSSCELRTQAAQRIAYRLTQEIGNPRSLVIGIYWPFGRGECRFCAIGEVTPLLRALGWRYRWSCGRRGCRSFFRTWAPEERLEKKGSGTYRSPLAAKRLFPTSLWPRSFGYDTAGFRLRLRCGGVPTTGRLASFHFQKPFSDRCWLWVRVAPDHFPRNGMMSRWIG